MNLNEPKICGFSNMFLHTKQLFMKCGNIKISLAYAAVSLLNFYFLSRFHSYLYFTNVALNTVRCPHNILIMSQVVTTASSSEVKLYGCGNYKGEYHQANFSFTPYILFDIHLLFFLLFPVIHFLCLTWDVQ